MRTAGAAFDEVQIRLYGAADAGELAAAVQESVGDIAPWMGWARPDFTVGDAAKWIATQELLARDGSAFEFGVWHSGRFAGGCGVNQINHAHRFGNVGYWIRTSAAGRGLAGAAVNLVAQYAFEAVGLVRVELVCAVGNLRSQRVAVKLGAEREGILRNRLILPSGPSDAVMFSLVPSPETGPRTQRRLLRSSVKS